MEYVRLTLKLAKNMPSWLLVLSGMAGSIALLLSFFKVQQALWFGAWILLASVLIAGGYGLWKMAHNKKIKAHMQTAKQWLINQFNWSKRLDPAHRFKRRAQKTGLPWFLMIGPSQSGKTALLKQSGITFSELPGFDDQNAAGYCLNFAEEGVVIDVKGDAFFNESKPSAWQLLVKKLKRLHKKNRLNAILLVLDYQWLLKQERLHEEMAAIRLKIDELYQSFGLCLPVFLVVNKCDMIQDFSQSFADKYKDQLFGIDLTFDAASSATVSEKMDGLHQELAKRPFSEIHLHSALNDKISLLQFPKQFAACKAVLLKTIKALSHDSVYQDKLTIKGLYFTSANTDNPGQTSSFVTPFLQHVFQTKTRPRPSQAHLKKISLLTYSSMGVMAFMLFFGVGSLSKAYLASSTIITHGKQLALQGRKQIAQEVDEYEKLTLLVNISQHIQTLKQFQKNHAWSYRLGLSHVNSQLDLYQMILAKLMHQDFYLPAKHRLEQVLHQFHKQWQSGDAKARQAIRGEYYGALKLYLMLNFPKYIQMDFATFELTRTWQNIKELHLNDNLIETQHLTQLSSTYLNYLLQLNATKLKAFAKPKHTLIQNARYDLSGNGVANFFALFEAQGIAYLGQTDLNTLVGQESLWQNKFKIPKLYTLAGYRHYARPKLLAYARHYPAQDWVLKSPVVKLAHLSPQELGVSVPKHDNKQVLAELHAVYMANYFNAWQQWLKSFQLAAFSSLEDAQEKLSDLSQLPGPMAKLLFVIHQNISLKKMLDAREITLLPQSLQTRFQEIESFTGSRAQVETLKQYGMQLAALTQEMDKMSKSPEPAVAAMEYAEKLLNNEGYDTALYKTFLIAEQNARPLSSYQTRLAFQSLLLLPVQESFRLLVHEAELGLNRLWQQTVLKPYSQELATFFPFNPRGKDVDLQAFTSFFMPKQGVFDHFMAKIQPFMQQNTLNPVVKSWLGIGLSLSPEFLASIQNVKAISKSFFPMNQGDLSLHFAVYPIPTPGLKEIVFSSNNQVYPYRNGPQEWITFTWPGQDNPDNGAFIQVTNSFADLQAVKEYQGVWGLFHLFLNAEKLIKTQGGYLGEWRFESDGDIKKVRFKIAAKTRMDPFLLLSKPLRLPESIVHA